MNAIKDFLKQDREYYRISKESITEKNNETLKDCCIVYTIVLVLYSTLSTLRGEPSHLRNMYFVFDIFHFLFCIVVYVCYEQRALHWRLSQLLCFVLEITIFAFFALEGGLASKTEHSMYVAIPILLGVILFIHPIFYMILISVVYLGSYASIAWMYKEPRAASNDLSVAVATFIAALFGSVLVAKLRHEEGIANQRLSAMSQARTIKGIISRSILEETMKPLVANSDRKYTFLLAQLDDFAQIFENTSAEKTNVVLEQIEEKLHSSFRSADLVCQMEEGKFFIVLDDCEDMKQITARIEEVYCEASHRSENEEAQSLSLCFGITGKRKEDSVETIIRRVGLALYEAKLEGKAAYRVL